MSDARGHRVLIGIGNVLRGDDAAGIALLEALRGRLSADVEMIVTDAEPAALIELLEHSRAAYLLDASRSNAPPGTVRRFDLARASLPAGHGRPSTHELGVAEGIELARALGALPRPCVLYTIEGVSYAAGAALSKPVRTAIAALARRVAREINDS